MTDCAYVKPRSVREAMSLLAEHGTSARLLAGGTDFVVRVRKGHWKPAVIVDLKGSDDLDTEIRQVGRFVRIGAGAVMSQISSHSLIRKHYLALAEAAFVVGSVQIRNRATLAGNICNASPAADTAPPLLAYGAMVHIAALDGNRALPLEQFFLGPGQTALAAGDIVTAIDLPLPDKPGGSSFGRVTRRWGVDLATINLCCNVLASGETRFAYGAVGPKPFVVADGTGLLSSPMARQEDKEAILRAFISQATPRTDVRAGAEYRRAMLAVMSRRCLRTAMDRLRSAS